MKRIVQLFLILNLMFIWACYSQDTLKHIKSKCLDHIVNDSDSCVNGINFRYFNDTLEIYGKIQANCCGEHFVKILRSHDTIIISSFDTGQLCNCICTFCFDILIPASPNDTIIEINGTNYNAKHSNRIFTTFPTNKFIEIFPNPTSNFLIIKNHGNYKISRVTITDISAHILSSNKFIYPEIDLSQFELGFYIIIIDTDSNEHLVRRIIKN